MQKLKLLVSSILAGMLIAFGGTIYLSSVKISNTANIGELKVIGALLFATGLFTIVTYKLALFTGKVGYLVNEKRSYLLDLVIIFFGNLIGTAIFAYLILGTREAKALKDIIVPIVEIKENDTWYSILLLSIPCGFLMHFAVDVYKKLENHPTARYISVFLGVTLFIISGFEHVIANLFYITLAQKWSVNMIFLVLIMAIGNGIGAVIIPLYEKLNNYQIKNSKK